MAPLQTVLGNLAEAEVFEEDIPGRLLAAADQLAELRAKLAGCQLRGPGLEEAASEALACVDRGDLNAAIQALQRGREAGWTSLAETQCEEAELYAREALIDHLRVRFCDAAGRYAAAAALILEFGSGDAWPFLIRQARELCDDGLWQSREPAFCRRCLSSHAWTGLTRAMSIRMGRDQTLSWPSAFHAGLAP